MRRRIEAIKLKLNKAKAFLSEVNTLLENKFYRTAIHTLYYSCFHATKALLLTKDIAPKTHSGTAHLLHQHFVLPGLFDKEKASFFGRLMDKRIDSDYGDSLITESSEVEAYIEPAKEYFQYVTKLVEEYLKTEESMNEGRKD